MDHLGIKQFFFMGYCIGGCFAMKLMERAPERVVAGVLVQTVGHHPEHPDYMYNSGRDVWAPELLPRRPDLNMAQVQRYLHALYRAAARVRLQRVARLRALLPNADARPTGRNSSPPVGILYRGCLALPECRDHGVPMARAV